MKKLIIIVILAINLLGCTATEVLNSLDTMILGTEEHQTAVHIYHDEHLDDLYDASYYHSEKEKKRREKEKKEVIAKIEKDVIEKGKEEARLQAKYLRHGCGEDGFKVMAYGMDVDMEGYGRDGYDKGGYDRDGFNKEGFNRDNLDKDGYNRDGIGPNGYTRDGYDRYGYHRITDLDRKGFNRDGYNNSGYDINGHDINGYNKNGYSYYGRDKDGYDKNGYDEDGWNKSKTKHKNGLSTNSNPIINARFRLSTLGFSNVSTYSINYVSGAKIGVDNSGEPVAYMSLGKTYKVYYSVIFNNGTVKNLTKVVKYNNLNDIVNRYNKKSNSADMLVLLDGR